MRCVYFPQLVHFSPNRSQSQHNLLIDAKGRGAESPLSSRRPASISLQPHLLSDLARAVLTHVRNAQTHTHVKSGPDSLHIKRGVGGMEAGRNLDVVGVFFSACCAIKQQSGVRRAERVLCGEE